MKTLSKVVIAAVAMAASNVAFGIQSDVASGKSSTLFINNGSLYCSGSLAAAVCGDGADYFDDAQKAKIASTYISKSGVGYAYFEPTYIEGADNVASVDSIFFKNAWLTKDGRVFWMGVSSTGKVASPTEIPSLLGATDFSLMGGSNNGDVAYAVISGQVFLYNFDTGSTVQVEGLPNDIVSVDADSTHALFLSATGDLYAAGDNMYGQLGSGDFVTTDNNVAVAVVNANGEPLIGVQKISTGHDLSMAVVDGVPFAWGRNRNGALGLGSLDESISREYADAVTNFEGTAVNVSTNGATLIHGANGTLYGMGWHNAASLRSASPTLLVDGGVEDLYVNNGDTWFVRHDGEVKGWGGGLYGQHGHGSQQETHSLTGVSFIGGPTQAEVVYVEVPVEKIVYVDRIIEVVKEVEVVKVVTETVEVPVEVIKEVEVVKVVTETVEVPVEVVKVVTETVEVEKIVYVDREVVKEVVVNKCDAQPKKSRKAKRGWGYGDKNHTHTGPKGRQYKSITGKKGKTCKTRK